MGEQRPEVPPPDPLPKSRTEAEAAAPLIAILLGKNTLAGAKGCPKRFIQFGDGDYTKPHSR